MEPAFVTDTSHLRLILTLREKNHRFQNHFTVPKAFWTHSTFFSHINLRWGKAWMCLSLSGGCMEEMSHEENKYGKRSRHRCGSGKDVPGGFALLGSHWWWGWAKAMLVIKHQGAPVTWHGFTQDFGHSGEEEEDKSFRGSSNTALVKRINISSRTTW